MTLPNILYIHSHDTGRYIQPYGYPVPAPNLQKLAEQGILFRKAFTAAPTCSPSRACLLTGMSAHSNGMIGLAHRGFKMRDYERHIVHPLRKAGYTSTLIGIQHEAPKAEMIGYDTRVETPTAQAKDVAAAASDFFESKPAQPFFLAVGFWETHREYHHSAPTEDTRYIMPPAPLPDTPETRQDMADYMASARLYDQGVGQVLAALERTGLAENTLVIATTDHGIAFPGMKCNLTDHGTGVMLVMRGPGGFSGGQVVDAMISQIDVFPTIFDYLGIPVPEHCEGHSFLPIVQGKITEINQEIYGEVTYHAAYEPMRSIRTQRYKYIRRFDGRDRAVLPNCDDSYSKSVWMGAGWPTRAISEEYLYDLVFDPNEANNLADNPTMKEIRTDLRNRLDAWMQRTHDPLCNGFVPAPAGAMVNAVNGISPREQVEIV